MQQRTPMGESIRSASLLQPSPYMSRMRGSTVLALAPLILWAGWKRARVELYLLDRIPPLVFLHKTIVPARSHAVDSGPHHHETSQLATRVPLGTLTNACALRPPD